MRSRADAPNNGAPLNASVMFQETMTEAKLTLSGDEALVLFEFFERYEETGRLVFKHPAEYLALMKLSAQIDKNVPEAFDPNYKQLLEKAKERIASGFEGEVPGMEQ